MQLQRGNIWDVYDKTDALIVTTNAIVRREGLVMGAGSALEAARLFPHLPKKLAKVVMDGDYPVRTGYKEYGFIFDEETHIGALQTKYHYRNSSPIFLLKISLAVFVNWLENNNLRRVDMVFPAIGYGGQDRSKILPLLIDLPNNVFVWEF